MSNIRIHDKEFSVYLTEQVIMDRVKAMATAIDTDYKNKQPLLIAILNGSFMFASDLFRQLTINCEISFIKLASYRGMKSSGDVITSIGLDVDLFRKDVLVIEDIVDTGKTLYNFLPKLRDHQPASLRIVALLHKPDAAKFPITIDYTGFNIPDKFVVGYGLDYDGLGRNLKQLYQVV